MAPYRHPKSGAWMCPCGQPFPEMAAAALCSHPATGGKIPPMVDTEQPDWWSPADEAILRGELQKLAGLPRPAYVACDKEIWVPPVRPPRRWVRELGAVICILGIALGIVLLLSVGSEYTAPPVCPGDPAGCADLQTVDPTTVGPAPGPTGR